ncbi:MAG: TrkA family potassium uptake protein [Treponemataceae bacterium]
MKQFAIIGLSYFGKNVLEELLDLDTEVLIIDKDPEVIDHYKDHPVSAIVLDVLNEESLRNILPKNIDGVVIDLGEKIEASILATSYCRKIGVPQIIVKAETEGHAEILELVGATKIVFPNREAAKRITPLLVSSTLLNYLPVSGKLIIAELEVPARFFDHSLLEANLRQKYGLNLISVKNGENEEYGLFTPDYRFRPGDVALVSGNDESLEAFAGVAARDHAKSKRSGLRNLGKLFGKIKSI